MISVTGSFGLFSGLSFLCLIETYLTIGTLSSAFSHYADLSVSEKLTESFKFICHHQPRGSDSDPSVCVTSTTRLIGADICIWKQENVDLAGFESCK